MLYHPFPSGEGAYSAYCIFVCSCIIPSFFNLKKQPVSRRLDYESNKDLFDEIGWSEDFFEKNVYIIAKEKPDENLLNVMKEKFPGCTWEITDEADGFVVYKYNE